MAYRLTMFGSVTLPAAAAELEIGPPPAALAYQALIGGRTFNAWQGSTPPRLPYDITLDAELVAETTAELRAAFDELAGQVGVRAYLWRMQTDTSGLQYATATLAEVRIRRTPERVFWLPVTLTFSVETWPWLEETRMAEVTLSGSPQVVSVTNHGNAPIDNLVIIVTANGTDVTSLRVTTNVAEWQFSGIVAAGNDLSIDCGAWRVQNDGVDAFDDFSLTAQHISDSLLPLRAGQTDLTFRWSESGSGAAPGLVLFWTDGWA